MELRCAGNKLHGTLDGSFVEILCRSVFCKPEGEPKAIVFHRWNVHTGEMITRYFKEPGGDANDRDHSLRSA